MNLSFSEAPLELIKFVCPNPIQLNVERSGQQFSDYSSDDIQEMLSYLDPDMPYEQWVHVGMALHEGGFDFELWDEWSNQGSKYAVGECASKWRSFSDGGGITIGTLLHMAKNAGYQKPVIRTLNKDFEIPVYHWSELQAMPKRQYLVKGLLEQGAMSVVYGASNSGKTFLALDIACHIALGRDWCTNNTRKGTVVYIAAEGGLGISERLEAFRKHHQLESFGDVYVIPTNVCLCKNESAHEALLQRLSELDDVKLIVVDTLARAMGSGDENSSSDMGSFIKNCDIIRHKTKAHLMIVHHSGKDENRGARGHSSLKAAIDTEIRVVQQEGIITAEVKKQREGQTGQKYSFDLKPYEVDTDEDGDMVCSCALEQTANLFQPRSLSGQAHEALTLLKTLISERGFDYVPEQGMKTQKCVRIEAFREHFKRSGVSGTDNPDSLNRTFNRQKSTLREKGHIGEWDGYVWLSGDENLPSRIFDE
ncbi:MAG: AAA family ATPase [Anaerolineae bacterium]|nr:AAA family ATPase [Anaerolineae bacterium]